MEAQWVLLDGNRESTAPVKRLFRRGTLQIAAEDASEHGHGITAADIFEYQWPLEKDSEYFMLQEQISMYLDVKSFKRKYPDLFRRVCDKQEKDFLRNKGVVSETQSDLGLTALKADEVHDLMSRDYPAKYKEFLKILREREKQKIADKMKEFHSLKLEKDKMVEYTKKAMRSVSEWNRSLLKKKNEERKAYFDMQTFTIQYPKSKFKKLDQTQTQVTAYPLSLIPGQFQDHYRNTILNSFTSFKTILDKTIAESDTALFDPPKKVDASAEQEVEDDDDDSQVDDKGNDSSDSDDSSSSSSDDDDDDDNDDEEEAGDDTKKKKEKSASREVSKEKSAEPGIKQENECRICKDEALEKQKETEHEELIVCSECKSKGHPTCLDLNGDMVRVIKTYPWQCMECKTCVQCMDPYDEDKMLFCDKCDRGYHTFCVGLKSLPTGQWDCFSCRGDTTPIKPLPRPTPKAKRGRKPGRPPGRPGRPPGRPPKDPNKVDTPNKDPYKRDTPGRDRRRRLREESTQIKDEESQNGVKDEPQNGVKDEPTNETESEENKEMETDDVDTSQNSEEQEGNAE
ncbi:PHD finger protein 10-like [Ruditapes philippinarum]|uniref:PHD finger protein 10-like n=1 Tax=Ruditapes philippinarum TaxID=129788 RepID=UPI00295B320B|nr:PHD finger protein 10-like [Ruditapes philippinarum]